MARPGGPERRAQFIATAQQLFKTKGYENSSINDIINAVGVSKGAFYHHFDSKEEVLMAVVDSLIVQTNVMIQPILNDTDLTAIEKFNQIIRTVNDWKIEQRDQMLTITKAMYSDDNLLLLHRLNVERKLFFVPILAQIFEQGAAEGLFELGDVSGLDLVEFTLAILRTASETFINLLLDPNRPANAADIAADKFTAAQKTVERILGAPTGSLPIIDKETIRRWFA